MKALDVKKTTIIGLLIAPMLLAVGINIFIVPNSLAFGGVSGAVVVLQDVTGMPIYVLKLFINLTIVLVGWLFMGREFLLKTIIPSLLIPLYIFITAPLQQLEPGIVVSVIYGPILMGASIGIILSLGGSTAGPDTVGEIIEKRLGTPAIYIRGGIDFLIILAGLYSFGFETTLYSIIVLVILHVVVDRVRKFCDEKMLLLHGIQDRGREFFDEKQVFRY